MDDKICTHAYDPACMRCTYKEETPQIIIKNRIFIIVTALNEVKNLLPTYHMIKKVVKKLKINHLIGIVDDGSTDGTAAVADEIKALDPTHVEVVHNATPHNLGGAYKQGIKMAKDNNCDFVVLCTGDDEMSEVGFTQLLSHQKIWEAYAEFKNYVEQD